MAKNTIHVTSKDGVMNDEVHVAKQSSENGWATKSTFVKSSDVPKQKRFEAQWAN